MNVISSFSAQIDSDVFTLLYGTFVDNFGDRGLDPMFRDEPDMSGEIASSADWALHDALNGAQELPGGDMLLELSPTAALSMQQNLSLYREDYADQPVMLAQIDAAISLLEGEAYDEYLVDYTVRNITTGDEEDIRVLELTDGEQATFPYAVRDEIASLISTGNALPARWATAQESILEYLLPYIRNRALYDADYDAWERHLLDDDGSDDESVDGDDSHVRA